MEQTTRDLPEGQRVIPLTILTGFLGAGKTTLLNRILNGDHGLRVAVLVNDFGSINIDADLVVGVESDVISLANGCVCCSIRDDLIEAVVGVLDRPERPEYVLLEASGVADPAGIAQTFGVRAFHERIRLDSIACVVDAEQVFAAPEQMQLKVWQIGFADLLILNKVDLAGAEQAKKVRGWLDDQFNRLRIVETSHCEVPLEILLSAGRFDPARSGLDREALGHAGCTDANCRHENHDHSKTFGTWSYETDRPLSLDALREATRKLPGNIYRCKGVVYSLDAPERRAVLQVVGRRVDISMREAWGRQAPSTRIVAIGAAGSIDARMLEDAFASCISTPVGAASSP
jgi:G3E family GTPase